jgi:hypothetical protein
MTTNLAIRRGADYAINIAVLENTFPYDFTGKQVIAQIRHDDINHSPATFSYSHDDSGGNLTLTLTSQQTLDMFVGRYIYSISVLDENGLEEIYRGDVYIIPESDSGLFTQSITINKKVYGSRLAVKRNSEFFAELLVVDNGSPYDFTETPVIAQIGYDDYSGSFAFFNYDHDETGGNLTISLTKDQTEDMLEGRYVYTINVIKNDGMTQIYEGELDVIPEDYEDVPNQSITVSTYVSEDPPSSESNIDTLGVISFAAWNADNTGSVDVTAKLQEAMNYSYENNLNLYIPSGRYLITSLTLPANRGVSDLRDQNWEMYGAGCGEHTFVGGTKATHIVSSLTETDTPVISDIKSDIHWPHSNGRQILREMKVVGSTNADVPIISLSTVGGGLAMEAVTIEQYGLGDGLFIEYCPEANFYDVYCLKLGDNKYTGVGFNYQPSWNQGLATFRSCHVRAFDYMAKIATNSTHQAIKTRFDDCQVTDCINGLHFGSNSRDSVTTFTYMEAVGTGNYYKDEGHYNTVCYCNMGADGIKNPLVGIDLTGSFYASCVGNRISVQYLDGSTGIKTDTECTVESNTIICGLKANSIGIHILGGGAKNIRHNFFDPANFIYWTNGSVPIKNEATNLHGTYPAIVNNKQHVITSATVITPDVVLSTADISGGNLTIPPVNKVILESPGVQGQTFINSIDIEGGHIPEPLDVTFILKDAAIRINKNALLQIERTFVGPGVISINIWEVSPNVYAKENWRMEDPNVEYTEAEINSYIHFINYHGKYKNKQIWVSDSTPPRPVWASGGLSTDPWVDATGAIAYTPS